MDNSLPVVQVKESHALNLDPDPDQIPGSGTYTLAIAPYPGIAVGAEVTLTWQGWFDATSPDAPWDSSQTVQSAGQVLLYALDQGLVGFIEGGFAQVSYRVADVDSPVQRLDIMPSPDTRLPVIKVVNQNGESLDPQDFPDGLMLEVSPLTSIQLYDDVLLYAASTLPGQNTVKALRVDQPALDAGKLVFTLEPAWLQRQLDETVTFDWQYARPGAAGSSHSLALQVLAAWRPSAPAVDGALPEDDEDAAPNQGYIDAMKLRGGGVVKIPVGVPLGDDDRAQVHWQGFGSTGSYIAEQADEGNRRQFSIPPAAVPANMGKRLDVFYTIARPDEPLATSKVYDLRIVPLTNFTGVHCAHVDLNRLQLGRVPPEGALLTLRAWTFMAAGQQVTITADSTTDETVLQAFPVTAEQVIAGQLTTYLRRAYLESLPVGAPLVLRVWVSFDDGHSQTRFSALNLVMAS